MRGHLIQFNSIQFYLYSAFYNTGLSQSSFTKGPGLRPPQSKPRATVARKNTLISRKKPWAEPGFGGGAVRAVNRGYTGKNALLMREVSGEGPDWPKVTGRSQ